MLIIRAGRSDDVLVVADAVSGARNDDRTNPPAVIVYFVGGRSTLLAVMVSAS